MKTLFIPAALLLQTDEFIANKYLNLKCPQLECLGLKLQNPVSCQFRIRNLLTQYLAQTKLIEFIQSLSFFFFFAQLSKFISTFRLFRLWPEIPISVQSFLFLPPYSLFYVCNGPPKFSRCLRCLELETPDSCYDQTTLVVCSCTQSPKKKKQLECQQQYFTGEKMKKINE